MVHVPISNYHIHYNCQTYTGNTGAFKQILMTDCCYLIKMQVTSILTAKKSLGIFQYYKSMKMTC